MGNLCDSSTQAWPITSRFEKSLNIARYSIEDIKLSFCNLYQNSDTISRTSLKKGLANLMRQDNSSHETQLQVFIEQFQKQNIVIAESDEYHFKTFLAVMFLLSCSSQNKKAQELFMLYDYSHNGSLNQQELKVMLTSLFQIVYTYSTALQSCQDANNASSDPPSGSDKYIEMEDPRQPINVQLREQQVPNQIRRVITVISKHICDDDPNKEVDMQEFKTKIRSAQSIFKGNILSVDGIRKILKQEVDGLCQRQEIIIH